VQGCHLIVNNQWGLTYGKDTGSFAVHTQFLRAAYQDLLVRGAAILKGGAMSRKTVQAKFVLPDAVVATLGVFVAR
jgi:hypothetical protein